MKLGRWWLLVIAVMLSGGWQFTHAQSNAQYQQMQRQMEMQRQQDQMRQQEQMRRQQEQMQRQQEEMRRRQQEVMQRQQEEMRRRQQETMARQQDEVRRRQQQDAMARQQMERQRQLEQQRNAGAVQRQVPGQRAMPGSSQANRQASTGSQRGPNAANNNAQAADSNRNVKLTRPLTPGEIRRGFTGRTTADGKAFVRYRGGVVLVPASRVAGLVTKPPANTSGATRVTAQSGNRKTTLNKQQMVNRAVALAAKARSGGSGGSRPPGGRGPANDNLTPRAAHASFFKRSGVGYDKVFEHRSGVDFSKPARITTLKAGTVVCQHSVPGNKLGNYFAPCGQSPTSLGIAPTAKRESDGKIVPRKEFKFLLTKDVHVFDSTAKEVEVNWSGGGGFKAKGGGQQYFAHKTDLQNFVRPANDE